MERRPRSSMLDLFLKQLDFFGGQGEQAVDAVVEFGFGGVQGAREAGLFGALLCQIRFPFVGDARILHRVCSELEALFQGLAKRVQGCVSPCCL